jgi:hypothetical protein
VDEVHRPTYWDAVFADVSLTVQNSRVESPVKTMARQWSIHIRASRTDAASPGTDASAPATTGV